MTFEEWYETSVFPSTDDSVTARAAWDYQQKRIAELEQQLAELRDAAREVVAWDWAELKYSPYHSDWFEALVDVGLLEKLLQESEDVV
jgi:hypothetical protein